MSRGDARATTATFLREAELAALASGDVDVVWATAYLRSRDDLETGARFEDAELDTLPAGMNIRHGLRELERRGLLEIRVERPGRPSETWSVFVGGG